MKKPYVLGLTGSIGMGKSTTADFFSSNGVPVWDADAAVHRLYEKGGKGVSALGDILPEVISDGKVDRNALRAAIIENPDLLKTVEDVIHPLVSEDRNDFIHQNKTAPLIVCDIPLLFETNADEWLDGVLVVTAPPEVQRARVMARPNMNEKTFQTILAKQMPDAEKRKRADFLIDTNKGLDHAEQAVNEIIHTIEAKHA